MRNEEKKMNKNVVQFPTKNSRTDIRKDWHIGGEKSQVVIRQISSGFGENTKTMRMAA